MRMVYRFRPFFAGLTVVMLITAVGCGGPSEIAVTSYGDMEDMQIVSEQTRDSEADSALDADLTESKPGESQTPESVSETDVMSAIAVYVCGAVMEPDVYYLPEGARIYDAIKASGGFAPNADTQWLNQAQLVSDGEMLLVYTLDETARMQEEGVKRGSSASGGVSSATGSGDNPSRISAGGDSTVVNLNTGSKEQLMTLPGIGESKADAIIRYRTETGPFASVEDVMNISGIKNSTFDKIKDRITV